MLSAYFAASVCHGDEIFNTKITDSSSLDSLGWTNTGQSWSLFNYESLKADLTNNPGLVLRFRGGGTEKGLLIKKFPTLSNPLNLTLTFDAGWGWGGDSVGGDTVSVLLLDDKGNGYIFAFHRIKAKWAAQWGLVSENELPTSDKMHWSPFEIDATQPSVLNGGGLQTVTITRKKGGDWKFGGAKWKGGTPFEFSDKTTSSFTQVVLYGTPNINDILFANIKLDVTK